MDGWQRLSEHVLLGIGASIAGMSARLTEFARTLRLATESNAPFHSVSSA